jgi:hypothetical protein
MAARFTTVQLIDSAGRAAYADRVRDQVAALAERDAEAYQAVLADAVAVLNSRNSARPSRANNAPSWDHNA